MPKVIIDPFAGIDLRRAYAATADIRTLNDIHDARPVADAALAAAEAAEDAEALAAMKANPDLRVASWVGAANAEAETQPTLQPKRRRKKAPAA